MTERRPHWDDELIFAVMSAAGDGGHLFIDDIHAVIAAVEDWQDANGFSRAGTLTEHATDSVRPGNLNRLIDAEAAIQRVREELEAWKGGSVATARILRALDDNKGVNND